MYLDSPRMAIVIAVLLLQAGCDVVLRPERPVNRICGGEEGRSGNDIVPALFVADSQVHGMTGSRVRTLSGASDVLRGVAVRPPEANAVSHLVLKDLVARFDAMPASVGKIMFYLGDAVNISCGGEFERFSAAINRQSDGANIPWFMAHGNHDSYFSGMYSHYSVNVDDETNRSHIDCVLERLRQGGVRRVGSERVGDFFDYSFASAGLSKSHAESDVRAWHAVCGGLERYDVPMNKIAWIVWYLAQQQAKGLVIEAGGSESESRQIRAAGSVGGFPVRLEGRLRIPRSADDLMAAWDSYIVQVVKVNGNSVVLVDTSVAAVVGRRLRDTAGSVGNIGLEQLAVIERMIRSERDAGQRVWVAGHFPLSDINDRDRMKLLEVMNRHNAMMYLSAHTHAPSSRRTHAVPSRLQGALKGRSDCIREVNIASTSDWPMEAAVIDLASGDGDVRVLVTGRECHLEYRGGVQRSLRNVQACAHAPAVAALARVDAVAALARVDAARRGTWESPPVDSDCDIAQAMTTIDEDMKEIERRWAAEPPFRKFALCLATAAASTECGVGHDSLCDARLRVH